MQQITNNNFATNNFFLIFHYVY